MELIDQHTKKIMEGCKERAQAAGLRFQDESLEYIVTNRDLLEISPKLMMPTNLPFSITGMRRIRSCRIKLRASLMGVLEFMVMIG